MPLVEAEWVFCDNVREHHGRIIKCGHKVAAYIPDVGFEIRRRESVMTLIQGVARVGCPACDREYGLIVNA